MDRKYGFIGCGNMGGALVRSAAKTGKAIYIADRNEEKLNALKDEVGAEPVSLGKLAETCNMIFLGVKPQGMAAMLSEIKEVLEKRAAKINASAEASGDPAADADSLVIVTMAAGFSIETIRGMLGEEAAKLPVIRIMPNLPVSVGEGMTLYCTEGVSIGLEQDFLDFMKYSGKLLKIDEKLIDAGSAVSGCGPAFVYLFIEAMADGGVSCGLPRGKAQLMAAQTLIGAAQLLLESGRHPGELKDAVCSPGGTTIAGVLALEAGAFRSDVADAVIAAYDRTLELRR